MIDLSGLPPAAANVGLIAQSSASPQNAGAQADFLDVIASLLSAVPDAPVPVMTSKESGKKSLGDNAKQSKDKNAPPQASKQQAENTAATAPIAGPQSPVTKLITPLSLEISIAPGTQPGGEPVSDPSTDTGAEPVTRRDSNAVPAPPSGEPGAQIPKGTGGRAPALSLLEGETAFKAVIRPIVAPQKTMAEPAKTVVRDIPNGLVAETPAAPVLETAASDAQPGTRRVAAATIGERVPAVSAANERPIFAKGLARNPSSSTSSVATAAQPDPTAPAGAQPASPPSDAHNEQQFGSGEKQQSSIGVRRAAAAKSPAKDVSDAGDDVPPAAVKGANSAARLHFATTEPARPTDESQVEQPAQPEAVKVEATQAKPAAQTTPAREIAVRMPETANGKVDLHIVERGGKITVDVRTANPELAQSLRGHVDDLVSQLQTKGYRTETWTLADRTAGVSAAELSGQQLMQDDGRNGAEPDPNGGRQQQTGQNMQQQHNRRSQAAWAEYFDNTLNDATATDARRF